MLGTLYDGAGVLYGQLNGITVRTLIIPDIVDKSLLMLKKPNIK